MATIYHNPRCSKSREAIQFLDTMNQEYQVVLYLEKPLTVQEIKTLLDQLQYAPIELVRTNELIWKQEYRGKELSDEDIIQAMIKHPQLIERPIVIHKEKAVVARPATKIKEIF